MNIKTIKKSIAIKAPATQVWDVLFNNEKNTRWLEVFSEGSHAETDWKEGSPAIFKDKDGNGIVGKIATHIPHEYLTIEYDGMIMNGVTDTDSHMAQGVKGIQETYRLDEEDGNTTLNISCGMGEEWFDDMSSAWDKALDTIKALAEQQN